MSLSGKEKVNLWATASRLEGFYIPKRNSLEYFRIRKTYERLIQEALIEKEQTFIENVGGFVGNTGSKKTD